MKHYFTRLSVFAFVVMSWLLPHITLGQEITAQDFADALDMPEGLDGIAPRVTSESSIHLGDVDGNGEVSIVDALKIAQTFVGLDIKEDIYLINADVDGDEMITIVDALLTAQYYVGIIDDFPIERSDSEESVYYFASPLLEQAVAVSLGNTDGVFTIADLRRVQSISIKCDPEDPQNIDLSDVPAMLGLDALEIHFCIISDLSPLADLIPLQESQRIIDTLDPVPSEGAETSTEAAPSWIGQLTDLELFFSNVADLSSLPLLTSVKHLSLGWTLNLDLETFDLEILADLENLTTLDIRGTGIRDTSALSHLPNLETILRGRHYVDCRPGTPIGDADGDGAVTSADIDAIDILLLPMFRTYGGLLPSDNIDCIDIDNSGLIDANDIYFIDYVVKNPTVSLGHVGVTCTAQSIIGDADGDGTLTEVDVDLIDHLAGIEVEGYENLSLSVSDNICCVDINGDHDITSADGVMLEGLIYTEDYIPNICDGNDGGIGIITYDLQAEYSEISHPDGEPLHVPLDVMREHHLRSITNPFLGKADLLLLPEFMYSNRTHPIRFDEVSISGEAPIYRINALQLEGVNPNPVALMVDELRQKAQEKGVSMVVPLAEIVNGVDIIGTAAVIDHLGQITHLRRKGDISTFDIVTLETREGQEYKAIITICSELSTHLIEGQDTIYSKILGWKSNEKHVDLLLYPAGITRVVPGDEAMKRIQYFGETAISDIVYEVLVGGIPASGFADYLVFSGLAGDGRRPQGVFDITKVQPLEPEMSPAVVDYEKPEPLQHVFTSRFEDDWYTYARVDFYE